MIVIKNDQYQESSEWLHQQKPTEHGTLYTLLVLAFICY